MSERISIIVPVYSVEQYLDRCVQSIVDQTYTNLEIILVDDGSPDRCPQICDDWSRRDSRIKVIHQKNTGLSAARNAGIRAAQGAYLCFVDSDDWIAPELCEKGIKAFSAYGVDIVVFDCERITEAGRSLGGTELLKDGILSAETALIALMQGRINNYAWNKIYKRTVFHDIWFPEGRVFEDIAVAYKLFLNANQVYCLNEQLYFYYLRDGSITSEMSSKNLGDLFLARWGSYVHLKTLYPDIAELVFPNVTLCALRLYDISLWESVEEDVFSEALAFLKDNKEKILKTDRSCKYWLHYSFPICYRMLRLMKHYVGNAVRALQRHMKCTG